MVIETKFNEGEEVYYADLQKGSIVKLRVQIIRTETWQGYTHVAYFLGDKYIGYIDEYFLFKSRKEAKALLGI